MKELKMFEEAPRWLIWPFCHKVEGFKRSSWNVRSLTTPCSICEVLETSVVRVRIHAACITESLDWPLKRAHRATGQHIASGRRLLLLSMRQRTFSYWIVNRISKAKTYKTWQKYWVLQCATCPPHFRSAGCATERSHSLEPEEH